MYKNQIKVNKTLYPAEALLKAAYHFIDKAYIHFDEISSDWIVNVKLKTGSMSIEEFAACFENELIIQTVRFQVFERTRSIREILMARAMTSTLITEEDPIEKIQMEQQGVSDSTLQEILIDWFDRYE